MKHLPAKTNSFTEYFNPEAISLSGTTVTVTKIAHGLGVGSLLSVTGSEIVNSIVSITDTVDGVVFETQYPHDLSLYEDSIYSDVFRSVSLSSASSPAIDGSYTLTDITDRTHFTLTSFPDVLLTDVKLLENREVSINGLYDIKTATADTFTFELQEALDEDHIILPSSVNIHYALRVRGASTIERVVENYNPSTSGKLWGYVILDDVSPNKSIYSETDANVEMGGSNDWQAIMLQPFSFYVFVPELDTTDGMISRDACEDLRLPIYQCLCGKSFATGLTKSADSATAPNGDGPFDGNNKAYYIHKFDFMQNMVVTQSDTLIDAQSRAISSIQFDYLNWIDENGRVIVSTIARPDVD
jgi:hypothetical protein